MSSEEMEKPKEMGRKINEKSDSESDNEGSAMMGRPGYSKMFNRSVSGGESFASHIRRNRGSSTSMADKTGRGNRYSRENYLAEAKLRKRERSRPHA
ncbi:unnamed protein product [Microthlaspi erraticum]|uniref:Uncharacterized protein n=1 Tax=Microthlaspi erraticum TaxID=1685480 RepID=A0A6D2K144_9BRAS|nr:unnamed protein product [Microthlaspi erraticum]